MRILFSAAALGLISLQAQSSAASGGEVRATPSPTCLPVAASDSRHVSEICIDATLAYNLGSLFGEPIVESRVAWDLKGIRFRDGVAIREIAMTNLASITPELRAALADITLSQLKLGAMVAYSKPVWLPIYEGVLAKSGAGLSMNTPGSPSWEKLFTSGADGCKREYFVRAEEAKEIFRGGIKLERISICEGLFGGLHAVSSALAKACMVEPGGPACKKPEKKPHAEAKKKDEAPPKAADTLAAALSKSLTNLDGKLAGATVDKEAGFNGGTGQGPDLANLPANLKAEAEQRLASRRAAVSDNYKSALASCENSQPRRPMEKVEGLTLTSEWKGCDHLRGNARRACKNQLERNIARAKEAEAERKRREQEEYEERLAAYEREIAVWPQTLAACKTDAENDHALAIKNYRVELAAEAARIRDIRKMGNETLDALTKALKSAN